MSRPGPREGATAQATQTLLEFMRRCQREVDWERSPHRTLPAAVAGWLVAQPGEPAEVGGMRPIGQIHDELLGTIRRSGLGRLEREVLCGWYGLGRFPARLTGPGGLVGAIGGEGPLSRSAIAGIRADGVRALAGQLLRPQPQPVVVGPIGDPTTAAWFADRWGQLMRRRLIERAFDVARSRGAAGGGDVAAGETWALLDHLDQLEAAIQQGDRARVDRREFHRARSQLAIALWQVSQLAAVKNLSWDVAPAVTPGRFDSAAVLVVVPPAAAALLSGSRTAGAVEQAAVAAVALAARAPRDALAIAELALIAARTVDSRQTEIAALRAAIAAALPLEDFRAIAWAQRLIGIDGTDERSLRAANDAAIVAGAHLRFGLAERLLEDAIERLPRVRWAPGRSGAVEIAEWDYQLRLTSSAQHRRQLEALLLAGAARPADRDLRTLDDLVELCAAIPGFDGVRSDDGDADAGYPARAFYRRAEFRLADAHRLLTTADGRLASARMGAALSDLGDAGALLKEGELDHRAPTHRLQLIKSHLWVGCLQGDEVGAIRAAGALLDAGWVLTRSAPPIHLFLRDRALGVTSAALPEPVRRAAAAVVDTFEGRPRPAAPIVGEVNRRRLLGVNSAGGDRRRRREPGSPTPSPS